MVLVNRLGIALLTSAFGSRIRLDGATYHAKQESSAGGVARNIAESIYKMCGNVHLISAVGNDQNGTYIRQLLPGHCASSIVTLGSCPTASFTVLLDRGGDCRLVVGDMAAHQAITPDWIKSHTHLIQQAPITVIDANISETAMTTVFEECLRYSRPVFFEPTDMRIATRPYTRAPKLADLAEKAIKFSSPNLYELRQLAQALRYPGPIASTTLEAYANLDELLADLRPLGAHVNETIEHVLVTLGHRGVAVFRRCSEMTPFFTPDGQYRPVESRSRSGYQSQARFYRSRQVSQIVNVSGAGDSFTSGFIVAALTGRPEATCVSVAFEAARCALQSHGAVAGLYFDVTHPCWTDANGAIYRTF